MAVQPYKQCWRYNEDEDEDGDEDEDDVAAGDDTSCCRTARCC